MCRTDLMDRKKALTVDTPWAGWIPGVLSKSQIKELWTKGFIMGSGVPDLDQSSIDLSLSDEAFKMAKGSVKPPGDYAYNWFIEHEGLGQRIEPPGDGVFKLDAKETYVFKLNERLNRSLADARFYGQATAKSSVGRVDVLARLIVDGMDSYEGFTPEGLGKLSGDMYLEITPITFSVKVKPGSRLTQLRLFYGDPRDVEMKSKLLFRSVLHGAAQEDGSLSVDLTCEEIRGCQVAAFCADSSSSQAGAIPLWKEEDGKPDPCRYWKFVKSNEKKRLTIEQDKFYLLRSKEKISVPPGIAIYCRASDETIGEMRIHYAGFAHPFFGYERTDGGAGTPLIFEVRGHQVNVTLTDGEKMASLTFYRMSKDGEKEESAYQNQSLELSKFFAPWPGKLKVGEDGTVEKA